MPHPPTQFRKFPGQGIFKLRTVLSENQRETGDSLDHKALSCAINRRWMMDEAKPSKKMASLQRIRALSPVAQPDPSQRAVR